MSNNKAEIKHNKITLEKASRKHSDTQLYKCTREKQCLLHGQCLSGSIVYEANITAKIAGFKEKVYFV